MKTQDLIRDTDRLICFGWTGSNVTARDAHISELAAHGVPRPGQIPIMVELSPYLLTSAPAIEVTSATTSAEVEFVIIVKPTGIFVSAGSDHTDRDIERHSIPAAKQMCGKILASAAWRLSDVIAHWETLVLRCSVRQGAARTLYQEAPVTAILQPAELLARAAPVAGKTTVLFSGTIPTLGGIICGDGYDFELIDPVSGRSLTHSYTVRVMRHEL